MADSNLAAALAPDISGPPAGVSDTAPSLGTTPQPTPPTPIPPPDIGSGLPSAPATGLPNTAPSFGAPAPQPAAPAPDLPRFRRTFANTLKGLALGFELGGIPGAVTGAISPKTIQQEAAGRAQAAQTAQHFADARAAHELAQAASLEQQVNAFNETHQADMEKIGIDNVKAAQEAGFSVVAVTPLDGPVHENAQAAMNNLQQIKNNNGGVVPTGLLHIHAGNANGIITLQLANPAAALDTINQARRAQGLPQMTQEQFMTQPATDRAVQAKDALNFTWPTDSQTGKISQDSVTTLQNRLALVNAQPEFNGKDQLVANLQRSLDFQSAALQDEAKRKGQATGLEAQAAQPGKTAAEVANINATAGPEATAAGKKAGAEAAARFPYELKLKQEELAQNPVFAVNPKTKQRELTTMADAKANGYTNPTKVSQADIEKETQLSSQVNDMQLNQSRYRVALNAMGDLNATDRLAMTHILSDPSLNNLLLQGAGFPAVISMAEQSSKGQDWNSLSPDKQDALIGYLRMKNTGLLAQKVLTGMGRASKEALDIELANMPSPIEGATVGNKKLDAWQQNIDQMASRTVKLPWMEGPQDVRARIEGEGVNQYNQRQAAKPQGQYRGTPSQDTGKKAFEPGMAVVIRGVPRTVSKVYQDGTFDVQ